MERYRSERGAILIQAAVSSMVMFGIAAFVIDFGIFWIARGQAQNAADAAAAAGALSRAYDEPDPPADDGPSEQSARLVAGQHLVWTEAPTGGSTVVSFDCPPAATSSRCVTVEVHRDTASGNPLPTFFGPLLGVTSQNVRATASAQTAAADVTDCLRPWALPDRWNENYGIATRFERYVEGAPQGTLLMPAPQDEYVSPTTGGPGSGLTVDDPPDVAVDFAPLSEVYAGRLQPLVLPGPPAYEDDIIGCNGQQIAIGDQLPISTVATEAQTLAGFEILRGLDPAATWDAGSERVADSCAPDCAPISPRLVAVALFDVDGYEMRRAANDWGGCPGGAPCIRISNIVGMFIGDAIAGGTNAFLTQHPGFMSPAAPAVVESSSFLKAVTLVR